MSTKFSVLYIHLMLFVTLLYFIISQQPNNDFQSEIFYITMVDTLKVLFSYLYYEYVINEGLGHP